MTTYWIWENQEIKDHHDLDEEVTKDLDESGLLTTDYTEENVQKNNK